MTVLPPAIDQFRGEYRWLSNFYQSPIRSGGYDFPCVEHAYQAAKTHDPDWARRISLAPTAEYAKRLGQRVPLRPDWEQVKLRVMADLIWVKFTNGELRRKLIDTRGQMLVEGNTWHDQYWGSCNCDRHVTIPGHNWLGMILMDTRSNLLTY